LRYAHPGLRQSEVGRIRRGPRCSWSSSASRPPRIAGTPKALRWPRSAWARLSSPRPLCSSCLGYLRRGKGAWSRRDRNGHLDPAGSEW
jgi:hypothetical protein